ncbi:type VI secretion system baseplate subunit TssE [Variovorax sp. RHLX14]|uniref:type VI secretion system baseplate subunit TssE n=1 Tax=Variovorax sp. RHLX14 TaxID=1259731 RepID=UPI003F466E75
MKSQLLPNLFDRLRDDAPSVSTESPAAYVISAAQLRDSVQRDLAFLLNTTNVEDLIDRRLHSRAAASAVNFGMPPLAGANLADRRWADIQRNVRRAIADHEPRLLPDSISVVPLEPSRTGGPGLASRTGVDRLNPRGLHVLQFAIHALIDARPYPLSLTVQSSVDLDTSRLRTTYAAVASSVLPDTASSE